MTVATTSKPEATNAEPSPTKGQSTALARSLEHEDYRLALEPKTFGETVLACEMVSAAGLNGCESPPQVLVKVMAGRALGMSFMSSVRLIHNIKGTLSLAAKAKVGLCLQSPLCEYFRCTHTDEKKAIYVCKRVGKSEQTKTYTIEEAEKSGLVGRGDDAKAQAMNNYNRFPAAMLRARCSSDLADMEFPDVTGGMAAREDLLDGERDPDEMVGEVVPNVAKRDWGAEAKAMIARIDEITAEVPPPARKALRDEVIAFGGEAPEPHKGLVGRAWNDTPRYVAPKAAPAPAAANGAAPPHDPPAGA
jgi:hypothetical protein